MTNLVVFMEPSEHACYNSLKGGNLILNRFCIDEDAGFELSGVSYLKKTHYSRFSEVERKEQGKENFLKRYSS